MLHLENSLSWLRKFGNHRLGVQVASVVHLEVCMCMQAKYVLISALCVGSRPLPPLPLCCIPF